MVSFLGAFRRLATPLLQHLCLQFLFTSAQLCWHVHRPFSSCFGSLKVVMPASSSSSPFVDIWLASRLADVFLEYLSLTPKRSSISSTTSIFSPSSTSRRSPSSSSPSLNSSKLLCSRLEAFAGDRPVCLPLSVESSRTSIGRHEVNSSSLSPAYLFVPAISSHITWQLIQAVGF